MRIVSIVQQKGGAGKTTLACMLASGAVSLGKKVHCIDGDRNAQLSEWENRSQNYKWEIEKPEWPRNLTTSSIPGSMQEFYDELNALEQSGVELVVVDTRPGSNEDTEDIAYAADVILVPTRPVPAEYELSIKTHDWLLALRDSFSDLEAYPQIRLVLSDASPAIIDAMSPNGTLDKLTKTEIQILTKLMGYPFCQAAIPGSQICKQLPFIGPLKSAAEAYSKSSSGRLRENSIQRVLEVAQQLTREVMLLRGTPNA